MQDFIESNDDDSTPEEERKYMISKAGIEEILGWIRFQAQMCEIIHNDMETCDDKEHEIAMLMVFALYPWIEFFGIEDLEDKRGEK